MPDGNDKVRMLVVGRPSKVNERVDQLELTLLAKDVADRAEVLAVVNNAGVKATLVWLPRYRADVDLQLVHGWTLLTEEPLLLMLSHVLAHRTQRLANMLPVPREDMLARVTTAFWVHNDTAAATFTVVHDIGGADAVERVLGVTVDG